MNRAETTIIFLRIGWMSRYEGLATNDSIKGGGAFVKSHGYGHEIFNFKPVAGRVFGYVQPRGTGFNGQVGPGINIQRIGAASGEESIGGALAVWVATSPHGGSFIVGWYRNATIYSRWQPSPSGGHRMHNGEEFGFYVTAAEEEATLLPEDERVFPVPRGKGGMGQSNVWYADGEHGDFRAKVINYTRTRQLSPTVFKPRSGSPRQGNLFLRLKVERAAVAAATEYYTSLGYEVHSVEGDNVGWDLNAIHPSMRSRLKLEIKGLSGNQLAIDLTPNEYAKMKAERASYRLCVVNEALTAPMLCIFAYSDESQRWEDQKGRTLNINEIVAARCTA
ncbi:MAG: DUF3883 domain-containing protein [Tepidisphaeraceae bacterium]|jgi:uncharacterized protein DUF3883